MVASDEDPGKPSFLAGVTVAHISLLYNPEMLRKSGTTLNRISLKSQGDQRLTQSLLQLAFLSTIVSAV